MSHGWCPARSVGARELLAAGLVTLLATGGCARTVRQGRDRATEKRDLTFAFWAIDRREVALVHAMAEEFERAEPSVDVRVLEVAGRYYEKLMTLFAADDPPDVFVGNYGRLGDFARRGLLADLTRFVAQDPTLGRRHFVRAAFDAFAGLGQAVGRPGLYALPRDWGPTGLLLYDVEAVQDAGLLSPDRGWTWSQYAAACRKLTVRDATGRVTRYGGSVNLYPYSVIGWLYQNGAEVWSPDGCTCTLESPACVEALSFIAGLAQEGVVLPPDPTHDDTLDAFEQGRVATALITPYSFSALRQCRSIRWKVAPPLRGKRVACGCIPSGLAVSAGCPEPEVAYRFARFCVTRGAERYAESALAVPAYLPALHSRALSSPEGFGPYAPVLRAAAVHARPYPIAPEVAYEEVLAAVREALDEVFALRAAPAEALCAAADRINRAPAGRQGSVPQQR